MSEKEKMNVNTAPAADASTGTAEDVEAIMKKYDRESNTRIWEGVPKTVVRYLLAAFALLMVYMNLFANWDERVRRSLFVGIVIILSFLVYPAKKGSTKKNHIPIYDIVLMVLGAGRAFPQVLKSIVYNLFYTTSGVIGTSASAPRISRCLSCSARSWRPPGSRSSLSSWPTPWRALPPEALQRWLSSPRPSAKWYPEAPWEIQLLPAP